MPGADGPLIGISRKHAEMQMANWQQLPLPTAEPKFLIRKSSDPSQPAVQTIAIDYAVESKPSSYSVYCPKALNTHNWCF